MKEYLAFLKEYLPDANPAETYYVFGYATTETFVHVLANCGEDLTREKLMKQAANIKDLELPMLLPGIKLNTTPTRYTPKSQVQLVQFDGAKWTAIGSLIDAEK